MTYGLYTPLLPSSAACFSAVRALVFAVYLSSLPRSEDNRCESQLSLLFSALNKILTLSAAGTFYGSKAFSLPLFFTFFNVTAAVAQFIFAKTIIFKT